MKSIRIAGGLGFYGDSWRPIKASIERGNVQYVASDHLAELTLAILQKDRQRDPSLGYTRDLAPMLHELGWGWHDWDKVAQGIVVGHLLECSGQATGGNFGGDWRSIPDLAHIGYPIAEVWENGEAVISKAPGTGGRVNFDTLREQLLYEVHDPHHYVTPDVDVDMTTVCMDEIAPDEVRVIGATGRPAPEMLKIVAGYEDG